MSKHTIKIEGFTSVEELALRTNTFDMARAFEDAKKHGFDFPRYQQFFTAMSVLRWGEGNMNLAFLWDRLAADEEIWSRRVKDTFEAAKAKILP